MSRPARERKVNVSEPSCEWGPGAEQHDRNSPAATSCLPDRRPRVEVFVSGHWLRKAQQKTGGSEDCGRPPAHQPEPESQGERGHRLARFPTPSGAGASCDPGRQAADLIVRLFQAHDLAVAGPPRDGEQPGPGDLSVHRRAGSGDTGLRGCCPRDERPPGLPSGDAAEDLSLRLSQPRPVEPAPEEGDPA
jgi:hypothetical protein